MWMFILILFSLWIGLGWLLLFLKGKPAGNKSFRRKVDKRFYDRAETVTVSLELTPPVAKTASVEDNDIVLVLDHSASMGYAPGSPLREAVRAMENFVQQLPAPCQVGLIMFDHEAQILCNITENKEDVLRALKSVGPGGNTQLHLALDKCGEAFAEGRNGVKKTFLLLSDGESDRKAADNAAARVREQAPNSTMICVGFGPYVDEALMKSVAGELEQNYIHVDTADDLEPLFNRLAGVVSGQSATDLLIKEQVMAPRPFHLETTGELHPVGIHQTADNSSTQVAWFKSLLQQQSEALSFTYTLKPECLGWHSVASADAQARWKMPNGTKDTASGAAGPKVLILPNGFAWAWWLLNPLFWLIFGRLFKCVQPKPQPQAIEESPLPTPTLPAPIGVPESQVYVPKVRPALVIGLGELGEWTLTRFKWQLQDRYIDNEVVDLVVIQDSGVHNRPAVTIRGCVLDEAERVIIQQDLRPYLEELRRQETPPESRYWVPWRQWLSETRPLTTYTDERRKARLALLLQESAVVSQKETEQSLSVEGQGEAEKLPLEERVKRSLKRIQEQEGLVLIVAGANDAEGSGMLAEVAHICASHGAGVTAILVPEMSASPETAGMVKELERMLIMRGESIPSDRGEQTVFAEQLFDRVIVANEFQHSAEVTSEAISHLLWDMLAYPELLEQVPSMRDDICSQLQLQGNALPQRSLWHWVREMTLSDLINQQWLGAILTENQVTLSAAKAETVKEYIAAFWDNSSMHQRLPTPLLTKSAKALPPQGNPLIILEELLELPLEKPYHEQKAYCDRERHAFSAYLEAWCYFTLEAESEKGQWGLVTLLEAVRHIEQDFEKLIDSVNKLLGNTALVEQLSFVSSIYTDYQQAVRGLRSSLERWIAVFVGWQSGMQVNPLPQDFVPVCLAIEKQKQVAVNNLPFPKVKETLEPLYKAWYGQYGDNLLQQLRFQVKSDLQTRHLEIQLRFFDSVLTHSNNLTVSFSNDLMVSLREALDRYKEVVFQWPAEDWVVAENVPNPANSLRLGNFSRRAYQEVNQVINDSDPFVSAAISINSSPLKQIFRLDENSPAIYAWPEEANAARIADNIRFMQSRQAEAFSPKVVSFMRDTRRLYDFMADLAKDRVTIEGQRIMLSRADRVFEVGSTSPQREEMEMFEDVVRQVVALGVSVNGELLPQPLSFWTVAPEEAARLVEQNSLVRAASGSPAWAMWKDVILGLALEHRGG